MDIPTSPEIAVQRMGNAMRDTSLAIEAAVKVVMPQFLKAQDDMCRAMRAWMKLHPISVAHKQGLRIPPTK